MKVVRVEYGGYRDARERAYEARKKSVMYKRAEQ
jgi:hypothetical protein